MVSLARNESSKQAQFFSDEHDFKKEGRFSPEVKAREHFARPSDMNGRLMIEASQNHVAHERAHGNASGLLANNILQLSIMAKS